LMEELDQFGARLSDALIALVDVDRFKAIHASLGDADGDAVLVELSRRLANKFAGAALAYRVGGDGFALLFAKTELGGDAIGADLVEVCRAPIAVAGRNVFAPVSVGVAPGHGAEDALKLLRNAELALMQAKREGGNCARVYTSALQASAPGDAVALETDLRRALDEGRIDLDYQPIVRLRDGTLAGFEALLRWNHPTRGLVAPDEFIAHSEETGLIVALGRFALERAVTDLAQWQRFFPLDPPLFVSVNFSRRQLQDGDFERLLASLLAGRAVEPGTLKLELTESAAIAQDGALEMLSRLRACGAGLAIDDFGTGASSLSLLKDLPFDTVKIDRSFLAEQGDTDENADGAAVLRSIVNLAHELERVVVVEGVETARDAKWLNEIGCEYAQGFYYSEPLPRADVLSYIARHHGAYASNDPGGAPSGVTGVG
jgi:diguanylate cyclase (GGDEF)-like protein